MSAIKSIAQSAIQIQMQYRQERTYKFDFENQNCY